MLAALSVGIPPASPMKRMTLRARSAWLQPMRNANAAMEKTRAMFRRRIGHHPSFLHHAKAHDGVALFKRRHCANKQNGACLRRPDFLQRAIPVIGDRADLRAFRDGRVAIYSRMKHPVLFGG